MSSTILPAYGHPGATVTVTTPERVRSMGIRIDLPCCVANADAAIALIREYRQIWLEAQKA
jgi:hypothetical protein